MTRKRHKFEQEMDEELRAHVEAETEENIRRGMTREEARRRALAEFGGLEQIKEEARELRWSVWLETLWQDIRYAARTLRKSPGFTAVAVLTLALSIGANTAIFTVVNAVLLRPLPYPQSDTLVRVWENPGDNPRNLLNPRNFVDWREMNRSFLQAGAFYFESVALTGDGEPERIVAARATPELFTVLGVSPLLGRTLLPGDDNSTGEQVTVISHGLWQRRFGADPGVVGRMLTVNGQAVAVVGVMSTGFRFPPQADAWLPIRLSPQALSPESRGSHYLRAVARLKPGVSVKQAQADLDAIYAQLREQYPDNLKRWRVHVVSFYDDAVSDVRAPLRILQGAVGLVFLIACANVAGLQLARGAARQKEIAVRAALGATRGRIVRQLLTESSLLALAGGSLGALLGWWGTSALVALRPASLLFLDAVSPDATVFTFTFAMSIAAGLVFGLAPAFQVSGTGAAPALQDSDTRSGAGVRAAAMRRVFVVSQLALSLVLLAGAGLLIRSLWQLGQVDPGFRASNVLTMRVALSPSRYAEPPAQASFYNQVIERVQDLPGVEAAAMISDPPVSGGVGLWKNGFHVVGRPEPAPGERTYAYLRWITPGYFRTLGIPLLRGRTLEETDNAASPWVVVVDEAFARQFFPGEDPIGKHLTISMGPQRLPREIVGIVGGVRQTALEMEGEPHMYVPYAQTPLSYGTILARTAGDPSGFAAAVRREVQAVDGQQPVYAIQTLEQIIATSVSDRRFNMLLLAAFAGVALALAGIGVYGVIAYSVGQRRREIAIRMALGAAPRDVFSLFVGDGLRLILMGTALGLAGAVGLTRLLGNQLYAVAPRDPWTFGGVTIVLAAIALLACWMPARRAMRVDPMVALRHE